MGHELVPFASASGSPDGSPGSQGSLGASDALRQFSLDGLARLAAGEKIDFVQELAKLAQVRAQGGTLTPPRGRKGTIPGLAEGEAPPVAQKILRAAHQQIGKPYVWGGETPGEGGFDCSGLIDWAFRQAGIDLPGRLTTYSAMKLGRSVKGKRYQPGDMVITNRGNHMVLYVGNGKVIAAPSRGQTVQYQSLERFAGQIVDVRRVL